MTLGVSATTTPRTAFGAHLRRQREARGVSLIRLATDAGFTRGFLSRLESGKRNPSRETVLRLASALNLGTITTDTMLMKAGFLSVADYKWYVEQEAS